MRDKKNIRAVVEEFAQIAEDRKDGKKNTTDTIKIKLIFLRCENCNLRH